MKTTTGISRWLPPAVLTLAMVAGCALPEETMPPADSGTRHPEGWTEETHGNDVPPDYEVVFPQDEVNRIEMTVSAEDWEAMQANLSELLGAPGSGGKGMRPMVPGVRPEADGMLPGEPEAGPRAPGIPGWVDMTPQNPVWVPATVTFNGLTWTNVGLRFKGNSSLRSGWNSGSLKLPLKLDFDEFEDDYPEIENQRFYGFKQLTLSNAFMDPTYMRDALAADILADSGLVAAETAWYEVVLDYGEGPVNLGLYVAIEVVDDTVIQRCFGDDSGNIYEADGPGADLAEGSYARLSESFLKENNEDEADWSDIEALYAALHSDTRLSEPATWRTELESVFDVDGFLEWLAISAVIQHWDTYGLMTHNFYLYDDPDTGLLNWISWDHNQILAGGDAVPGGARPGGLRRTVLPGREEVGANWPLIRYLLDDSVYAERYVTYMAEAVDGALNPETLEQQCREYAALLAPYAEDELGGAAYESGVQGLIDRIYEQHQVAVDFLAAKAGS